MSAKDVDMSRKIAHVRIHVEQVIGQLKKISHTKLSHTYISS